MTDVAHMSQPEGATLRFAETMTGTWRRTGEDVDRPMHFDVRAETTSPLSPFGTVLGTLDGTLSAGGLAGEAAVTGTIEVSPIEQRRIRYILDLIGDDGRQYRFDGWKSISWLRLLPTWTTLPGTIYDGTGAVVGTATLRFALRHTPALVASARIRRPPGGGTTPLEERRWNGSSGKLEVWYDTFTDPVTGDGFWLHHELVAPTRGAPAYAHGWAAVFPADGVPTWDRFGPVAVEDGSWFTAGMVRAEPGIRRGNAGGIRWDLRCEDGCEPMFTFPAVTWRRPLLPSAQIVASPCAAFRGSVRVGERVFELDGARGASARIYGNGNAEKWAWLHADLGDGDLLEIVAAVARHRPLDRLSALPFVQLRFRGLDWPKSSLAAAFRFRAGMGLPEWSIQGRSGNCRLRVKVIQPAERCVTIEYVDPDGSRAICTNTERADAHIVLEAKTAGCWRVERRWNLNGTAHAEIGTRR
ncbi:MAG: hypothetical protein ACYCV7_06700 [Acidimicrobiales bacterium]